MNNDKFLEEVERRGQSLDSNFKKTPYLNRVISNKELGIKLGDVVIDAGAWIGDSSLALLKCVGIDGRVVSIECDPISLRYLSRNVRGFPNIRIVKRALWSHSGEKEFIMDTDWTCSHSLCSGFNSVRTTNKNITVMLDTLDNIVKKLELDKIDYIKMNIEGAEIEALKGMEETINKFKPNIYVMCHQVDNILTTDECIKFLSERGYVIDKINDITINAINQDRQ